MDGFLGASALQLPAGDFAVKALVAKAAVKNTSIGAGGRHVYRYGVMLPSYFSPPGFSMAFRLAKGLWVAWLSWALTPVLP